MDSYVTATEARQRFLQLLDEVESGDQIVVTRRGAPAAVLIDFEKLETLKSLGDFLKRTSQGQAIRV